MKPGPVAAAGLIETVVKPDSPPRKAVEVLVEIIQVQGWFSGSDAQDKAEAWANRFVSRAQYVATQGRSSGNYVAFSFNSSSLDYLQGSCFVEPADSDEIVRSKKRRAQTTSIAAHCRSLTPARIEHLCGRILELLQVERAFVSRQSADQGIDFFGRVPMGQILKPSFLDPGAEKHIRVWLVGQAKHYPDTRIGTAEIRELVGSVELARAKIFAGSIDPLSEFTVRLCDPIIYIFITTGRFSQDSLELLDRSGVLAFDGLQVGQFLADHGVGLSGEVFDPKAFDSWLSVPV